MNDMGKRDKANCASCNGPINEREPHVSYSRNIETVRRDVVTVSESDLIEQRHLACDQGR